MERKPVVIAQEALEKEAAVCEQIKALWASRGRTPRAFVDTYGCQQNEADSERIRGMLRASGYEIVDTEEGADCIVINTCAIREHAETRVYGNVGALVHTKARHPEQKIFLCGCMMGQPQVVERIKNSYRHVDGVFNPHELWRFPELLQSVLRTNKRIFAVDDSAGNIAEGIPVVRSSNLKAWVSIMYGCNNFCSYCIVPYVRGRERSRRPEEILEEVKGLIAAGYKDITLLGQNVNSYGKDLGLGVDFADLMAEIAQLPGDFWLRFMTSHPKDASKKLFDTIAKYPKIAKQFHLPFQSGNDRVLKAMNRHYNREEYLKLAHYGRQIMPELVLTSDVIVGFPGETEEEFEDTISLIEDVRYDALFTFIFSPRAGTPAAKMDDPTPKEEKNRRFDRLCAVQNRISLEIHQGYVGKTVRVLCDGRDKDLLTARTEGGRLPPPAARRPPPPPPRAGGGKTRPLRGRRQPDRPVFGRDDHRLHNMEPCRRTPITQHPGAGFVGADAHIGPAECTVFTVFFGEFATSQRADVGIGPYKRMRKCIWICRKHNFRR